MSTAVITTDDVMHQAHLDSTSRINMGSYYTPSTAIAMLRQFIRPHLKQNTIILDNACGYGSFLSDWGQCPVIGCDIDAVAVRVARKHHPHASVLHQNSLHHVSRQALSIPTTAHLAVIGNPPYNDKTSLIRHHIKQAHQQIDADLQHRDLGLSFLLAYNKLKADVICVLHPLSYLIKKANFQSIKAFTRNYQLIDGCIISSAEFPQASKITSFPIIIALYQRCHTGMTYDDMHNATFNYSRWRDALFESISFHQCVCR